MKKIFSISLKASLLVVICVTALYRCGGNEPSETSCCDSIYTEWEDSIIYEDGDEEYAGIIDDDAERPKRVNKKNGSKY